MGKFINHEPASAFLKSIEAPIGRGLVQHASQAMLLSRAAVPRGTVLVIGYGNTLRGDDAAGPRAASAVAGWGLPGVIAKAVPQLTPELAALLSEARLAIFVDARLAAEGEDVEVRPIEPSDLGPGAALGHLADPCRLLALARMAYGTCPRSWLVTVPATDFSLGEKLSPPAERGLEEALRQIASRLGGAGRPGSIFDGVG